LLLAAFFRGMHVQLAEEIVKRPRRFAWDYGCSRDWRSDFATIRDVGCSRSGSTLLVKLLEQAI
jgi:hypothetical protein